MLDIGLRVVGALLACAGAALTVLLELLFAMLRVGGHLVGLSVLLAVVGNVALSWFAYWAVGTRWAVTLPAVVWFVLIVVAAGRTAEGDILLAGNWVGFMTVIAGSIAFAVTGFQLILAPRPGSSGQWIRAVPGGTNLSGRPGSGGWAG